MPRYFIQLAYNGKNYHGWQSQNNTPNTVQQVITDKLSMILSHPTELVGCGRTDAGVHAKDYYAHFDSDIPDLHQTDNKCLYKLNKVLPYDIAVKKIMLVSDDASARFHALTRTYDYYLHQHKNPFLNDTSLYVFGDLNFEAMNTAAEYLLKTTDFTSFSKLNTQTFTNNCDVTFAKWEKISDTEYVFKITANRFLRNMVRAIVGSLLDVGKEKINPKQFEEIIVSKNRSRAGTSAAAHALYLSEITYPKTLFHVG